MYEDIFYLFIYFLPHLTTPRIAPLTLWRVWNCPRTMIWKSWRQAAVTVCVCVCVCVCVLLSFYMNMSLFVKGIEILPYDELLSSLHKSGSSVTLMKHMHACAHSSLSACGLLVIMSTTTPPLKKEKTNTSSYFPYLLFIPFRRSLFPAWAQADLRSPCATPEWRSPGSRGVANLRVNASV